MKKIKRIGVLTCGGDCAGLNAIINAIVRCAEYKGIEVYGIHNGSSGLYYPTLSYSKLNIKDFQIQFSSMRTGGTILRSVNADVKTPDNMKEMFCKGVKELGLDSIVLVGGDGSALITSNLIKGTNINLIAIPKTIDNDTPVTDYSIGFDTARNICMDALDKLQTTAYSHNRIMIMEVMGRDAGHLALNAAIAGGADICLIPEIKYSLKGLYNKLETMRQEGFKYALMVVAEGCKTENDEAIMVTKNGVPCYTGFSQYISKKLEEAGFMNRAIILGHLQRGGMPTALDRITASRFGIHAINILCAGKNNRMVILKGEEVTDVDIFEAVEQGPRNVDLKGNLIKTARQLGIYLGDR